MKSLTKRIMIYSMAGMMQLGLAATVGATVIEASAFDNGGSQIVQLDDRHDQENFRHEREMRRHDHENDRDWHERQRHENERHEQFQRDNDR
jgi:hypothetical protein